ncbi:Alpha-ketoglutarate-dependent dioxygenase alkB 6 [Gryganskiella cystojenkinii]|nr:Alpha-ketoglutarate-dependent dioxygenase alkB 6 [Gryganskiella cystojenkinii]
MTRDPISKERLLNAPANIFYIPDFITPEEEHTLIAKVLAAPKPKWVHLKNRRLQNWGGVVKNNAMVAESLPAWLTSFNPKFRELGVFDDLGSTHKDPNHCLINEYLAGQGILPHKDGPAYLPTVATVSLSSHCILDFYKFSDLEEDRTNQEPEFSILVQPRSLLVLKEDVYNHYMHGIREVHSDDLSQGNILNLERAFPAGSPIPGAPLERDTRISLTFRIVPKTIQGNRFFAPPKK